jgi:nucleotide-binding universal stress UspA family protein
MTMSKTFQTILVPVDFSTHSEEALQYAATIAGCFGAAVVLLHVIAKEVIAVRAYQQHTGHPGLPPHAYGPFDEAMETTIEDDTSVVDLRKQANEALRHFLSDELQGLSVNRIVAIGHPFEQILEVATREEVDLIVMGTHGRTGLAHVLLGSVAERVVRMASCPVLTVKASVEQPTDG